MSKAWLAVITAILVTTGSGNNQIMEDLQMWFLNKTQTVVTFEDRNNVLLNPLTGFAPPADGNAVGDHSLVYIDITFAELEPEEGVFAFEEIDRVNQTQRWRQAGKHAVLRFVCDTPEDEPHKDVPEWLFDKIDGAGTYYDNDYGMGYSPDYENPVFIEEHEKAVKALGEHFGKDSFVSYVELGSLGHWGEWHVDYVGGIDPLPMTEVREQYITPYLGAFPTAKLMMRRPFEAANRYGFGLFNDMVGHESSTTEWMDWLQNGGAYNQTDEQGALVPMAQAWKTAPIGGEFTSDYAMDWMMSVNRPKTLDMIEQAHTTFLGPKIPKWGMDKTDLTSKGAKECLLRMGYRLGVEKAVIRGPKNGTYTIGLTWTNTGVAPLYWDWPVYLCVTDSDGSIEEKIPVDLKLSTLLPDETVVTETELPASRYASGKKICISIEDPMTGKPSVVLATQTETVGKLSVLHTIS